jgi:hypothetical protein
MCYPIYRFDLMCLTPQQYFSYIMATSFSGGGTRGTRREPPTMGKQLVHLQLRVDPIYRRATAIHWQGRNYH